MMHTSRRWVVAGCQDLEHMAKHLSELEFTCCRGFRCGNLIALNDSTGAGRLQEYAICKQENEKIVQYESITVSWTDSKKLLEILQEIARMSEPPYGWGSVPLSSCESSEKHGRCMHCA